MKKLSFVVAVCMSLYQLAIAQTCPSPGSTSISSFPNTYYPAAQTNVGSGTNTIVLGNAIGTTAISKGDILLIIQMQGAHFRSVNNGAYGANSSGGNGYYNNSQLLAGTMEYVVADVAVPLSGGTLTTKNPLVYTYQNTASGTEGQYTYQVVRVPLYYDLKLTGTVSAPQWNGSTGGIIALYAINNIDLNGQLVTASGAGFRGGGGRQLSGGSGGNSNDYMTTTSLNANGVKGEGIAGTPAYVLDNGSNTLLSTGYEGYPGGSLGRGAPGNAGGGGSDGHPSANDQNSGGGGGGNGGAGGIGGNSWSSNLAVGGKPATAFAQASGSRLVMGGGGGAGTSNNGTGTPGSGLASSGASGGGIVIMIAQGSIISSGTINADGNAGNSSVGNDASGGGGAGGSILIFAKNGGVSNVTASAKGGNGGNNQNGGGDSHGPGGGAGGGVILANGTLAPATTVAGGTAGYTSGNTTHYGAADGSAGSLVTTLAASAIAKPNQSCAVLATNYIDLSANLKDGVVHLTWDVTGEAGIDEYVVEKSSDGTHFSAIASIQPKNPGSARDSYQYADDGNFANVSMVFYRIVENSAMSAPVYSKIVPVKLSSSSTPEEFTAFPNPTAGPLTIMFNSSVSGKMDLQLFTLQGAMIWQRQHNAEAGANTLSVDGLSPLPAGMYILILKDSHTTRQIRIMVRR